jgi:uncharacterized protein (TIGR01244 family)
MRSSIFIVGVLVASVVTAVTRAQVTKETVAGVTNFARVESTVACAGATTPEAIAEVKRLGYRSIVNLRLSSEAGANTEAEEAAAKAAGITYVQLPFNAAAPDPAVIARFIEVVSDVSSQPVFVHCASGNRAAALWMIKRIDVDGWSVDQASEEATALGLTSAALKTYALDYARAHEKK